MQPSKPNEHGVLEAGRREVVACHGRAYVAIKLALCDDGMYRFGVEMMYTSGGLFSPIIINDPGYPTPDAARKAAMDGLLRSWHSPFPSDPECTRRELAEMRREIAALLQQPSLF
ncbi:MAG: hypothetical protein IT431_15550 [Phycisphaerales bacterium]|nr:hypothetical protein [Phycisphaerales bacterium]